MFSFNIKECLYVYQNFLTVILLTTYLSIASYYDIKERRIPDKLNLTFLIIRLILIPFVGIKKENFLGAIVMFLVFFIPSFMTLHKMAGDIKMAFVVGLYLSIKPSILIIGVSLLICLCYMIVNFMINKKNVNSIPYAPFFLVSFIILWIIYGIVYTK